ncbi:CPBP family intramembrane metalloprotease [Methanothermobacter sp. KEPCO-1]|nr:CPBP family intramembrane metalloprotease [Methanothermobacter sp. KEPCO-1]
MRSERLSEFFIVTFLFSWILWIPVAMISAGFTFPEPIQSFLRSPYNPAAFGPTLAAIILTYRYGGRDELVAFLRRGIKRDFPRIWWAIILLLFPVITALALYLGVLWGDPQPFLYWTSNPLLVPIVFLYIFFLGGPLQEEFGWRGYALPRLQERYAPIYAAIMVGIIWGLWHIPLFFIQGSIQSQVPFWSFMILIISASVIYTWVYNSTGSILAAMIIHTTGNLSYFLFPVQSTIAGGVFLMILNVSAALGVLLFAGSELKTDFS